MNNEDLKTRLNLVAVRIKEIFRYTEEKSGEVVYIDYNNNLNNVQTKCNTVIYGRRGSGKTTLLVALKINAERKKVATTFIDYNLYTDHRYPDLLIANLIKIFEDLRNKVQTKKHFVLNLSGKRKKNKIVNALNKDIADLNSLKDLPIEYDQDLEQGLSESKNSNAQFSEQANIIGSSMSASLSSGKSSTKEIKSRIKLNMKKIDFLYKNIDTYRSTLSSTIIYLNQSALFLLLDDFYHVQVEDQPHVIDYLFRLCKGQKAYLKIASISHRTKLYERESDGAPHGLEESADLQKIDLDFLLQRFDETESFLQKILSDICSMFKIKDAQDLFVATDNGFKRLVWASGGVPRDFLQLFVYCVSQMDFSKETPKIDFHVINKAAHNLFLDKQKNLETKYAKKKELDVYFNEVFDFCTKYNKRTAFLVNKGTKQEEKETLDKLNDLIDFKIVHLIHSNLHLTHTSKDVFEAYCLDLGSYALWLHKKVEGYELAETDILKKDEKGYPQTIRALRESNTLSKENLIKSREEIHKINEKILQQAVKDKEENPQSQLFPWIKSV